MGTPEASGQKYDSWLQYLATSIPVYCTQHKGLAFVFSIANRGLLFGGLITPTLPSTENHSRSPFLSSHQYIQCSPRHSPNVSNSLIARGQRLVPPEGCTIMGTRVVSTRPTTFACFVTFSEAIYKTAYRKKPIRPSVTVPPRVKPSRGPKFCSALVLPFREIFAYVAAERLAFFSFCQQNRCDHYEGAEQILGGDLHVGC